MPPCDQPAIVTGSTNDYIVSCAYGHPYIDAHIHDAAAQHQDAVAHRADPEMTAEIKVQKLNFPLEHTSCECFLHQEVRVYIYGTGD